MFLHTLKTYFTQSVGHKCLKIRGSEHFSFEKIIHTAERWHFRMLIKQHEVT